MSWLRALKETTRSGLRIERKRLEPLVALRGAVGLALVIALSLWLFGAAVAASSAFGAFQAAIATFQRSWRPRPELALVSGTSIAVSSFLGYLTIAHLAVFLALLVVWTFLAGLSWAAGPTTGLLASSNVAIMLVTVTLPTSVAGAAGHGAMMIVGGLVQAALIVLFPVRRWGAQRDALADALAAEADYARRLREDPVAPFDPLPLMEARNAAALTPRQARTRPAELHGARGLAERIRPVLAALADPALGVPAEGRERDRVRELLGAAARILDTAARAIRHGAPVTLPADALAAFRTPDTGSILTGRPYRAAARLGTLLRDVLETAGDPQEITTGLGQRAAAPFRAVGRLWERGRSWERGRLWKLGKSWQRGHLWKRGKGRRLPGSGSGSGSGGGASGASGSGRGAVSGASGSEGGASGASGSGQGAVSGASGSRHGSASGESEDAEPARPEEAALLRRPGLLGLAPVALRAMRKEVRRDSPVFRHAVRVSVVAAVGYLIGTWLPLGHGYWAPLASVMVMRPDFSQTYSRAVARFGGTLVGVALATGLVRVADPGTYLSGALAVLCAALMYLLMRTGQVAAQVFVAAYVVFLLGMGGQQWTQTVPERVLLTLIGGVLAMLAYAVYPAWETPRLRTRLADWLVTQGRYAAAVVCRYADPTGRDCPDVRAALLSSRTARAAWHTAVARAMNEPVRHRGLSRTAADDAEDALAQMGRVAMLMEAHLPDRNAAPVPAAARLADALRTATEQGAKSVRERRIPRWDAVREALDAWDRETAAAEAAASGNPGAVTADDAGSAAWDDAAATASDDAGSTASGDAAATASGVAGSTASGDAAATASDDARSTASDDAELTAGSGAHSRVGATSARPAPTPYVRQGAGLLLESLVELSEALDTAVPPMNVDGTSGSGHAGAGDPGPENADGPRNPKGSAAR
ncbi:FUSC family protein [Streptomyces sp. NPDC058371]|uniref:FUSC family protein n=1 Tax=Streptomyces sp. NPDC058371 TaxID=3346463 RepID=UPI003653481D